MLLDCDPLNPKQEACRVKGSGQTGLKECSSSLKVVLKKSCSSLEGTLIISSRSLLEVLKYF